MIKPKQVRCLCLALFLFGMKAQAAYESASTENEWQSTSIQALGGVGHMSEFHADQYFSDPSLPVTDKRKFVLEFFDTNVTVSKDLVNTFSEFSKIINSRDAKSQGVQQTVGILDQIRSVFGKQLGFGLSQSLLSFKVLGFSAIPYVNTVADVGVRVPSLPRAALLADVYGGLGLGYSHAFGAKKAITAGINARPGMRMYVKGAIDVAAVGDLSGSNTASSANSTDKFGSVKTGVYIPIDLGFGYQPLPIFRANLVVRDFLGATSLSSAAKPPKYPMRISLGVRWDAWTKFNHSLRFGTDLQDATNLLQKGALLYRWQWAGQYLYHLPFRNQTTFGLNTGLQAGYPAAGVFLDLFLFKLEAAYSVREVGYYIGQNPDTRYSFRISSQLSF